MDHGGTAVAGVRVKRVSNDDANARSVRRVRHAIQRGKREGERGDDRASTSNGAILLLSVHSCHLISFSLARALEGTAQGVPPSARKSPSNSPGGGLSIPVCPPSINTLPGLSLTLLSPLPSCTRVGK